MPLFKCFTTISLVTVVHHRQKINKYLLYFTYKDKFDNFNTYLIIIDYKVIYIFKVREVRGKKCEKMKGKHYL